MSGHKTFIDTNVLLYSVDTRDLRKQQVARQRLTLLAQNRDGVISLQVVNEFANNLIRKFDQTPIEAGQLCQGLSEFTLALGSMAQVREALRLVSVASISFWDASILASAIQSGCRVLLTEDLSPGTVIAGVSIVNPFA